MTTREQCPKCLDSHRDNLVTHSNGSKHCHACGYHEHSRFANGEHRQKEKNITTRIPTIDPGYFVGLKKRFISKKTCEKYGVTGIKYSGYLGPDNYVQEHPTVIFNWFKNSEIVRQKLRDIEDSSTCTQKGDTTYLKLFGLHAFTPSDNHFLILTEGEFDALAIHEATGYAAVSITNGAKNALKEIKENYEWLMKWKYVVLAFDNDEVGREAAKECAEFIEPGRCRLCFFPEKDANDMLKAGRAEDIKKALWNAEELVPEDLVTAQDVADEILAPPKKGKSWPWKGLSDSTYGLRMGELYVITGGTSIGKTEIIKDMLLHQVYENKLQAAVFSFEQSATTFFKRLIGGQLGIPMHIPGNTVDPDKVAEEVTRLSDKVYVWDRKRSADELLTFDNLVNKIKYLAKAKSCKLFVIDNLKGISATLKDNIKGLETCMVKFQALALSLNISFIVVSHLARDKKSAKVGQDDDSWSRGRMPVLENIYGSSAIESIADFVIALARNTEAEDPGQRMVTTVKCLKTRYHGIKMGDSFQLIYNDSRGRLEESVL